MVIGKSTWLVIGLLLILGGRYTGLAISGDKALAVKQVKNEENIRTNLIDKWKKWLPGDEGILAAGILIGGQEGWSKNGQENFRRVGLSHVVAASGYNVAVVTGWAILMLIPVLGRQKAIWFALVCTIMYMFLANWAIPVIRAGTMQVLVLIATLTGRPNDTKRALVLAVLGLLIWEPKWVGEVSFQLSVAATVGLIWLEPKLPKLPLSAQTSIAAQITTTPLIIHHFGQFSAVAPVVNALVLWVVPIIMELGAIATVIGIVWNELGQVMAWLSWPGLRLLTESARIWGSWEMASWKVEAWSWGWVMMYYLAIILIFNFPTSHFKLRRASKK